MANKTVSNLNELTTVSNSDVLLVETATETLKVTKGNLLKEVNEQLNAKSNTNHTHNEYVTENELDNKGLATETFVTQKIAEASLSGGEVDLSAYATKAELNTKADKSHTHNELHSHSNKTVLDGITSSKVNEWNNKSTFNGDYNSLTNKPVIPSIEGLATETYVTNAIANAQLGGGGTGGGGTSNVDNNLIMRYVHKNNVTVSPTSLDTDTGIFTCRNHGLTEGTMVVPRQNNFTDDFLCIHSELFTANSTRLTVTEVTDDTFKLKHSSVISSYSDTNNSKADISKYHFEIIKSAKIDFTDIPNNGNLKVSIYGLCGTGDMYVSFLKDGETYNANHSFGTANFKGAVALSSNATHAPMRPFNARLEIRKADYGFIVSREIQQFLIVGRTVTDKSIQKNTTVVQYPYEEFNGIRLGSSTHTWDIFNGTVVEIYNLGGERNE